MKKRKWVSPVITSLGGVAAIVCLFNINACAREPTPTAPAAPAAVSNPCGGCTTYYCDLAKNKCFAVNKNLSSCSETATTYTYSCQ